MNESIIGVDLGGTQMRAARFDTDLNLLERVAEPTLAGQGPERVIERLLALIARVIPDNRDSILGLGISAPGPINPRTGTIFSPPNLPGWDSVPLRHVIQKRFAIPTYLGNDANIAALAETMRGAAQGCQHVIYLTISTGIGSGIIDEGRLLVGAQGFGAEAGHMILVLDGRATTLEREAAGPAIARKARERIRAGASSCLGDLVEGDLEQITPKTVGEAAAQGDALARELIRQAGYLIGLGITSLMHLFNPQIIVIGGGVSKIGDPLFAPMHEAIQKHTLDPAYWENVPIVRAALGGNVALVGAAALVSTKGGSSLS